MALAASKGLLLTVYHNRRWDGDFLTLRQLIEADALGPIALFQMRCVHPIASTTTPTKRAVATLCVLGNVRPTLRSNAKTDHAK
jgi:predicted dehydrogenase